MEVTIFEGVAVNTSLGTFLYSAPVAQVAQACFVICFLK